MSEMAELPASVIDKDLKTGEGSKEEADVSGASESLKTNSSNTEDAVGIEDVQINKPPKDEEIAEISDNTAEETEQLSDRPVTHRSEVVELANSTGATEQRKARVFRKKFGEGMVHEMPSIFNKKL